MAHHGRYRRRIALNPSLLFTISFLGQKRFVRQMRQVIELARKFERDSIRGIGIPELILRCPTSNYDPAKIDEIEYQRRFDAER